MKLTQSPSLLNTPKLCQPPCLHSFFEVGSRCRRCERDRACEVDRACAPEVQYDELDHIRPREKERCIDRRERERRTIRHVSRGWATRDLDPVEADRDGLVVPGHLPGQRLKSRAARDHERDAIVSVVEVPITLFAVRAGRRPVRTGEWSRPEPGKVGGVARCPDRPAVERIFLVDPCSRTMR